MADVAVAVQQTTRTGAAPTNTGSLSTSNTYYTKNNGNMVYHFLKTGSGDATITVQTPNKVDGNEIAEKTLTVVAATSGDIVAGPFPPEVYNDSNGDIRFSSNNITGLTVAVLQLG